MTGKIRNEKKQEHVEEQKQVQEGFTSRLDTTRMISRRFFPDSCSARRRRKLNCDSSDIADDSDPDEDSWSWPISAKQSVALPRRRRCSISGSSGTGRGSAPGEALKATAGVSRGIVERRD